MVKYNLSTNDPFAFLSICRTGQGKFLWLGLTDAEDGGIYRWINGAPLYYSVWGNNEPNRPIENYVGIHIEIKRWADLSRPRKEFAFCSTIGKLDAIFI